MKTLKCTLVALSVAGAACGDTGGGVPIDSAPDTDRVVARTDIVSDQSGALVTEPVLKNAWGLAFNPIGAAWVSATESGVSTIYEATVEADPPVTIPGGADERSRIAHRPGVQRRHGAFEGDCSSSSPRRARSRGWTPDAGVDGDAARRQLGDDAVYKGVAIATETTATRCSTPPIQQRRDRRLRRRVRRRYERGDFTDPDLPDGYAPFNVEATTAR